VCFYNNYIYVADSNNHRIVRFDRDTFDGSGWTTYGTGFYGSVEGYLGQPIGVATDGTNVYVSDTLNNRIVKLDMDLNFVDSAGTPGSGNGQFNYPQGIEVDDDYIWIADLWNARIQKWDKSSFTYDDEANDYRIYLPLDVGVNSTYIYTSTHSGSYYNIARFNKSTLAYISTVGDYQSTAITGIHSDGPYVYETIPDGYGNLLIKRNSSSLSFVNAESVSNPKGVCASNDSDDLYLFNTSDSRVEQWNKGGSYSLTYSFAKLLAVKNLQQRSAVHDRVTFDTSLFGLDQPLGTIINVRRLDETQDTRVRLTQITRKPNEYKITLSGRQEGPGEGGAQRYGASSATYAPPLETPIGYWRMNQDTGASALDSSGNDYILTASNDPVQLGAGIIRFDNANNSFYSLASEDCGLLHLTGLQPMSIVARVRMTTTTDEHNIAGKCGGGGDRQYRLYCYYGKFTFEIGNDYSGLWLRGTGATTVSTGEWHTVIGTYDLRYVRLYLDGYLDENGIDNPYDIALYGLQDRPEIADGTADFKIGRTSVTSETTNDLDGDISYVAVFNKTLTQNEITYINSYWR
jgi:hypothetical protein